MAQTFSGTVSIQSVLQPSTTKISLSGDDGTAQFGEQDGSNPSTLISGSQVSIGKLMSSPGSKPASKPFNPTVSPVVIKSVAVNSFIKNFNEKIVSQEPQEAVADSPFQPRVKLLIGDVELAGGISIVGPDGKTLISLNGATGSLTIGNEGNDGEITVVDKNGNVRIHLDGDSGDIALTGADCAEEFDLARQSACVEPGSVMVIGSEGGLSPCQHAYDRRVAGVISGAGSYKPGIVLHKQPANNQRVPLALTGKVFCKVDASYGAVEIGDLLTTSPTAGYAMKVSNPLQAFGAILGKALQPLNDGQNLLPILVALQ
jgi:hypothetical protein